MAAGKYHLWPDQSGRKHRCVCSYGVLSIPVVAASFLLESLAGGFLLSLSIELIQLLLPDRWTDVDDLWMNTLGAGCGYWIFLLIPSRFHPRFWSPFSGKQDR